VPEISGLWISNYNESIIYEENGFRGEIEPMLSGKTIGNKNHGLGHLEEAGANILVIRNPFNTLKAEFNRKHTADKGPGVAGHTGHADPAAFNTTDWDWFVNKMSSKWARHYERYITDSAEKGIPVKLLYYENLQTDSVGEMRQLLDFLEEKIGFHADNKEKRLNCIANAQQAFNAFKRPKKALGWDIFTPEMTKTIDGFIASLRKTITDYNLPQMPEYTKPSVK